MPGWHKRAKKLMEGGRVQVVGLVQEQHPDRAALFMQWKEMDWPVFSDPFNDLGISAVPITLLIDEHGIIRYRNPKAPDLETFLATDYRNDAEKQKVSLLPKSLEELEKLVAKEPENARVHFRLGVAYRARFDSRKPVSGDFAKALAHWQRALELNPNQYIWRRRIQQYGPRLDKPYSFYDWVEVARKEIAARGEKALPLVTEPSGAEFAVPSGDENAREDALAMHPDPENKVTQDTDRLVSVGIVVVPSTNRRATAWRVHLEFSPALETTWTNDAGNISFYLEPGVVAEIRDLKIPTPPEAITSGENRTIEFEIHPKPGKNLPKSLTGSAFYFVCTKSDGTCRFLRHDLTLTLKK